MAAYNGGLYIRSQIDSILNQLHEDDELIVIDDCSTDNTFDILSSYDDERIRLFKNEVNLGHVKNFEKSVKHSSGDIIFLSDQDDLWSSSKYNKVINHFSQNPDVGMIYHSLLKMNELGYPMSIIGDDDGYILSPNRYRFLLRQLVKFEVFGCSIAFRRQLLDSILPFPKNITYAHDHWIASCAAIKSKVACINMPLTFYRQHDLNLTPKLGLSIIKKIKMRILLLGLIIAGFIRP